MKRLFRLLVIVGLIGAVVVVVMRAMRRRVPSYEMEEAEWEPPAPHPEPLQPAVVEADTAMPETAGAADVAGAIAFPADLQPEAAKEEAEAERTEAELEESEPGIEPEPHMAALETDARFAADAPEAVGSVEVSPTPPIEAEVGPEPHMPALETEHVEAEAVPEAREAGTVPEALFEAVVEAEAEHEEPPAVEVAETPEPAAEAAAEPALFESEAAEPGLDVRAEEPANAEAPAGGGPETAEYTSPEVAAFDSGASLATAETVQAEAFTEEAPAAEAPGAQDPDFLTRYFEELAATPEEAEAPVEERAPEAPASDVNLLESVEEALTDLSPVPIIPPPRRNAESYLDEGNVYFNVGQYGLAIERYTQAIELDADLIAAYYNRANARTRAGEFEGALQDYDRALQLQPNDADALNNRGMLHLYRANYAEALRDFNGALAADPSDTTVMVNRGLAHLHGGDPASALVDFREAATMDPADAAAHYGAAQASASLDNREEALRHIGLALQYDPGYAREAAGDPRLSILQGDETFLRLLRESGSRST